QRRAGPLGYRRADQRTNPPRRVRKAVTTQATSADTRELIVESAYACFRKQGMQKATIVDIARAAGVSRSTIYEYFRDKSAIVEACAEHTSEQFYRQMSLAMDRGGSLEDKLSRAEDLVTRARGGAPPEKNLA